MAAAGVAAVAVAEVAIKTDKNGLHIRYVGFRARPKLREYMFQVRMGSDAVCEFHLTISNEAFLSRRVRYQDAPDICAHRVLREMDATLNASRKPKMLCAISEAEIDEYRVAHSPKPKGGAVYKTPRPEFQ